MITILIPTAERPIMLATALRSVAEQTAVNEITEIIVSESAGDPRSRDVCRQFPSLPIQYIFREPPMRGVEHFSALKKARWAGEFTVMLHDDDWWTPDFLRKGIEALKAHPRASCFCCNSYRVPNEESIVLDCPLNDIFWFGANFPGMAHIWELNMQEVLLGCLLHTPANYSTILARAETLRNSSIVYDTGNRFDLDRMFIFELSRHGTVLYSPIPQAFYRNHAQQDNNNFRDESKTMNMCKTTEWMLNRSGEDVDSIGDLFCTRVNHCPKKHLELIQQMALKGWALPMLAEHTSEHSPVHHLYKQLQKRFRFRKFKPFIPPVIVDQAVFLRDLLKKRFC